MRARILFAVTTAIIGFLSFTLFFSNTAFAYPILPGCESTITCEYVQPVSTSMCPSGGLFETGTGCSGVSCPGCHYATGCSTDDGCVPSTCGCRYPEPVSTSVCGSGIQMVHGNSLSGCTGDSCSDCVYDTDCSPSPSCYVSPISSCTVSVISAGPRLLYFRVNWADINPGDKYTIYLADAATGAPLIDVDWSHLMTKEISTGVIYPVYYYPSGIPSRGAIVPIPLNLDPKYIGKTVELTVNKAPAGAGFCKGTVDLTGASCGSCTFPEPDPSCPSGTRMVEGTGCVGESCAGCTFNSACPLKYSCFVENPCPGGICHTAIGDVNTKDLATFAKGILSLGIGLAGGIALILMVIGSVRVLTSSGDQQKLNGGRDMIVAAVSGLLFLIFSALILKFVGISILGLP